MTTPTMLEPGTLDVLVATPAVLRALVGTLSDAAVNAAGAEGWSARDVVAHLASVQRQSNIQRVRLMLDHDNPAIPNINEEQVLNTSGFRTRPVAEVLDVFERERAEALTMLRALTPDDLTRRGQHSVAGEVRIIDIVHHVAYHDMLHIGQVAALLAAPIEQRRGVMRMF